MVAVSDDYQQFLLDIKQRVRSAQYRALQRVQEQMQLYWGLGQLIAEHQQQLGWEKTWSKPGPTTCKPNRWG